MLHTVPDEPITILRRALSFGQHYLHMVSSANLPPGNPREIGRGRGDYWWWQLRQHPGEERLCQGGDSICCWCRSYKYINSQRIYFVFSLLFVAKAGNYTPESSVEHPQAVEQLAQEWDLLSHSQLFWRNWLQHRKKRLILIVLTVTLQHGKKEFFSCCEWFIICDITQVCKSRSRHHTDVHLLLKRRGGAWRM